MQTAGHHHMLYQRPLSAALTAVSASVQAMAAAEQAAQSEQGRLAGPTMLPAAQEPYVCVTDHCRVRKCRCVSEGFQPPALAARTASALPLHAGRPSVSLQYGEQTNCKIICS